MTPDRAPDPWRQRYRDLLSIETTRLAGSDRERAAERDRRLRRIVELATERSPWHAARLGKVDVDTITADDLTAIPPMTRLDLRRSWDDIVVDRAVSLSTARRHLELIRRQRRPELLHDRYVVVESSGSSGMPVIVIWSAEDLLLAAASGDRYSARHRQLAGIADDAPIAWVHATSPTQLGAALTWLTGGMSRRARTFNPAGPRDALVRELNAHAPDVLNGYPSVIAELAEEKATERLSISPRMIGTYGETLTPGLRSHIGTAFGCDPVDQYSASECPTIAVQIEGDDGLVVMDEKVILEPVDVAGRAVAVGQPAAKVLLTNLVNTTLPLLRYELDDRVRVISRTQDTTHIAVEGRTADLLRFSNDVVVHPIVLSAAVHGDAAVIDFEIRQTMRGLDVRVLSTAEVQVTQIRGRLEAVLREAGIDKPHVVVHSVPTLERHPRSGKRRRFL